MKKLYRKKLSKQQIIILSCAALIAVLGISLAFLLKTQVEKPLYETALSAANKMQICMDAVKEEKENRGIELSDEDTFNTGMLGEDYNFITTTRGDVAAKRTTADPDMAAMMVFMLDEAGLKEGDTVGCTFSGSFPALDIAVVCACEEMGITPVYIASCGASTWGANNPEFSLPEMMVMLYEDGYINTPPALITPGGGSDTGAGVDSDLFSEIWNRVVDLGYPVMSENDFTENIQAKMQIFTDADIDCFISAGGNITALGYNNITDLLGEGIITENVSFINDNSGLLERYLYQGKTCIMLLNIKQLCADYGIPFDPTTHSVPGESILYYEDSYPSYILWGMIFLEILCMIAYLKCSQNAKNMHLYANNIHDIGCK